MNIISFYDCILESVGQFFLEKKNAIYSGKLQLFSNPGNRKLTL